MIYKIKIRLFDYLHNFLYLFGFQIFYSKKASLQKNLIIKNIIDVGVARGTDFLLKNYPNANYFFIEPYVKFHTYIEQNLIKDYNGKLFKYGAHNKNGIKKLYLSDVASTFFEKRNGQNKAYQKVKVDKLDNILKKENISKNTLLKIDTEGNELNVLKGSKNILKKINYLVLEVRLNNMNTYNPSELIAYCYKRGFIWDSILNVGYVKNGISYIDVVFKKKKK